MDLVEFGVWYCSDDTCSVREITLMQLYRMNVLERKSLVRLVRLRRRVVELEREVVEVILEKWRKELLSGEYDRRELAEVIGYLRESEQVGGLSLLGVER